MKRNVILTLVAVLLIACMGIFAACGEEKKPAAKDPVDTPADKPVAPPNEPEKPEDKPGNVETPDEPPVNPDVPGAPTEPEKPADPVNPDLPTPSVPEVPTTPTEPEKPADPPHTHSWDEGTVSRKATCKEEGIKTQTCSCGETKLSPIPMLSEHSYDNGVTANGVKTYTCTVCGDKKTEAVAGEHSHDWTEAKETKKATCKEGGEVTFYCACGEKRPVPTKATGEHNYKTTNGKSVCTVCGEEEFVSASPSDIG